MNNTVRVRFAPSPTGFMHLGNVRAALLNYLFAQKNKGVFIIRIEDTDFERNVDPQATDILENLAWLGLNYGEGPIKQGPCAPYFQSQRTHLYAEKLQELQTKGFVYRCFCSTEELEKKRQRQIALKQPPRYDRTCLRLSESEVQQKLSAATPFIWRLKTTQEKEVVIQELARGTTTFNLKDFSDIPLTRVDGSFTFIFANCVDDILMRISHVIRGEDHISNTASQVVLYESFGAPIPVFWHLPIICNAEGKKLSKRDFGFSLNDLKTAGYLPEAICNYLGIIGGSFEKEILSLEELAQVFNFENLHATGHIKYDLEKLRWMNHKWIAGCDIEQLTQRCLPFLTSFYPQVASLSPAIAQKLVASVKTDLVTLHDSAQTLKFYFEAPQVSAAEIHQLSSVETGNTILRLIQTNSALITQPDQFLEALKKEAKVQNVGNKELFATLRFLLTGSAQGLGIKEIFELLGTKESEQRLRKLAA